MNKKIKKIILKWMGVKENHPLVKNIPTETSHRQQEIWISLLHKCYVPTNILFQLWGAKGYRICKDWKDHPYRFFEWMDKNNWNDEMRIDIKKGTKIFSPSNCFLTLYRRYRKKAKGRERKEFVYEYNGKEKSLNEWSKKCGIKKATLQARLKSFHGDMISTLELPLYYRFNDPNVRSDISNLEIKELYDGGMEVEKIKQKFGFTGVYYRLQQMGVELRDPKTTTRSDKGIPRSVKYKTRVKKIGNLSNGYR